MKSDFLDSMLTPDECAAWMRIKRRELDMKTRQKLIPCINLGERSKRYHPRTVITTLALDGGVSPNTVAAMFSEPPRQ